MKSSMENMHTDVRVLRVKTFYAIMSLKICQILYLAGALVHFVEDMQFRIKKKLTLLTRNHAQYLDLFSFLTVISY